MLRSRAALVTSLCLGAITVGMASASDRYAFRSWPPLGLALWVGILLCSLLAAVLLGVGAFGMLPTQGDQAADREVAGGRRLSTATWVAVYVGGLALMTVPAIVAQARFGVPAGRVLFASSGALFLLAATGSPWWLFESLRRTGWFAAVEDDGTMRIVLLVIGAALAAVAVAAPDKALVLPAA